MKKIFLLILIFIFLTVINVYGIEQSVLDNIQISFQEYFEIYSDEYPYFLVTVYLQSPGSYSTYYAIHMSKTPIKYSNGNLITTSDSWCALLNEDGTIKSGSPVVIDGIIQPDVSISDLLISTHDIIDVSDGTVFFSVPIPPFLPAMETPSLVPTVANQLEVILVPSVVILGLMVALKLIPAVLYRL